MDILAVFVRLLQRLPRRWRRPVGRIPWLHALADKLYPKRLEVFPLAEPLGGHRMRLQWGSRKKYIFGVYEPEVVEAMQELVRPGQLAVDVGANLGYFTLLLAKQVGSQGRVIAFEPSPEVVEVLRENVSMNGYQNVVVEGKAVAERSGPVNLSQHTNPYPLSDVESIVSEGGIEVQAVSLDDYFNSDSRRVDLVKMDVEGAEGRVLKGMSRILEQDKPTLLIELHHLKGSVEKHPVVLRLKERGYTVSFLDKPEITVHILAQPARDGS